MTDEDEPPMSRRDVGTFTGFLIVAWGFVIGVAALVWWSSHAAEVYALALAFGAAQ